MQLHRLAGIAMHGIHIMSRVSVPLQRAQMRSSTTQFAHAQFHRTVCACAVPPHSLRMRSATTQFAHAQHHHTVCAVKSISRALAMQPDCRPHIA